MLDIVLVKLHAIPHIYDAIWWSGSLVYFYLDVSNIKYVLVCCVMGINCDGKSCFTYSDVRDKLATNPY